MEQGTKILWATVALILVAYGSGVFTGYTIVKPDMVPVDVCNTNDDELVFIWPDGCGDLCLNLSTDTFNVADEAGLTYREVNMAENISVPGVFVFKPGEITQTIPFDSAANLRKIMCQEFSYEKFC